MIGFANKHLLFVASSTHIKYVNIGKLSSQHSDDDQFFLDIPDEALKGV